MPSESIETLAQFQPIFNAELERFLRTRNTLAQYTSRAPLVQKTIDHVIHIALHGGKRLRPYMFLMAYQATDGTDMASAVKLSVALELFHIFGLIHDDIIDKGKERHGISTTHEFVKELVQSAPKGECAHIGNSFALLAGDIIFSWSYELIIASENTKVRELFSRMIDEVLVGQMLDVSLMTEIQIPSDVLSVKNELKTALYSFVNPMLMGHAYANQLSVQDDRASALTTFFRDFGLTLGQAFQIQDDVLDIIGDPVKTGKQNFLDIEDGQHTLVTQYIFEQGSPEERELLTRYFGNQLNDTARAELRTIFDREALPHAHREIEVQITKALNLITQASVDTEMKERFTAFVDLIKKRVV